METELIICEKPQAAAKIAAALGNTEKKQINKVAYYETEKKVNGKNKKILIGCAVGHLFTLEQKQGKKSEWPIFEIEWQPNFKVRKQTWSKKYFDALSKLCKQADSFILACDYDIEGEVIGWNVLRFICGKDADKKAKRMKFSTLTETELKNSYENLMESIDFGQAYAGETRHKLDWLYGINLSRALMQAIKKTGKFKIMSIGRVQGPALHLVVDKEKSIQKFKPTPYWQVFLTVSNSHKVEVKYPKDITKKEKLAQFKALKDKNGQAKTTKKQQSIQPPAPFDLTTLQTEAYRFYKISPKITLQIAQQLYLAGLISYPRTSSQKLPPSINYKKILSKLKKQTTISKLIKNVTRTNPIQGKKSDPAHPAIYPTGEYKDLSGQDKKIYELIIKRFVSCFCSDAIVDNKKIEVTVNSLKFVAKGQEIKQKAWMNVYPAKLKEKFLPDLNGKVYIKEIRIEEKQTKPPKRYTSASLVRELEKKNLGTKATRSSIVDTLFNRGYIKNKSIQATKLGISLIDTLKKNSPIIIDESLTREFEKQMEQLRQTKKELEKKSDKVIEEAKSTLLKIEKQFRNNEDKIGKELLESINYIREKQRQENTLTTCPKCGKGNLRILYNKKAKRYFIACDAYPKCKNTYTLPPYGLMKPSKIKDPESNQSNEEQLELCEKCGFPLMLAIRKGKRPWKFCFNPECETRKQD